MTTSISRTLVIPVVLAAGMFPAQAAAQEPDTARGLRLRAAAAAGDVSAMTESLAKGATIDASSKEGLTALMLAAATGRKDVLIFLVAKGAKPNLRTSEDRLTPLMFAAHGCHRAVLEALLAAKADASLKDSGLNGGRSAADYLLLGCQNNADEAASLMLLLAKNGATVMRRDAFGLLIADGAQPDIDALIKRTLAEK